MCVRLGIGAHLPLEPVGIFVNFTTKISALLTSQLVPKLQERLMSYYVLWDSPTLVTEFYSRMVDNFVDNVISATNLVNTLVIVNMESILKLTDCTEEYWRVGVENAKAISRSIREP